MKFRRRRTIVSATRAALVPRCSHCKSPLPVTWGRVCTACGHEFGKGTRIDYWYHRAARGLIYLCLALLAAAYVWSMLHKGDAKEVWNAVRAFLRHLFKKLSAYGSHVNAD